ncbi:MAG: heme ABC transporter ATP-binding protein [Crocinitomicaceae bacterium]|nr:heme ABC transporter ATP-binding protein [Crocinitomicaceae bacterium]|tara:strand:+ start:34080 stop:34898 length:819 start_codon:yes stop_codon:yes gene_type:complete
MITAEHISLSIGDHNILKNVSLKADRGDFIGILGPNGAGKSTLLKAISHELEPTNGNISWLSRPMKDWKNEDLAKTRGVLKQKTDLSMPLINEEVVMMGRYPHFKRSPQLLDYQAVEKALDITGTKALAKRHYHECSGGEQQRIQFARVWAQLNGSPSASPKLFLLDEPLNNLDIYHQHHVLRLADQFVKDGNIVIAVMHDINLAAMYMNKLLFLKNGGVYASGTPDEVLKNDILSQVYDYPLSVVNHPEHNTKMILHGYQPFTQHKSEIKS